MRWLRSKFHLPPAQRQGYVPRTRAFLAPRDMFLTAVFLLTAVGTVMIFSASAFFWGAGDDTTLFLRRHLAWVCLAGLGGLFCYQLDYRILRRYYWHALVLTIVLLGLVLVPGIGRDVNGSKRWLPLGAGLQFQPSELAKLSVILFVAGHLAGDPSRARRFLAGFGVVCMAVLPVFTLIIVEPDLGTSVFVLALAFTTMVLGGMRWRYLIVTGALFAPILALFIHLRWDEIRTRFLGFLQPEELYQVKHSLTALGCGGWLGAGLGAGGQKLRFLPEAHTDFILSVIGEELGLAGCIGVFVLFVMLLWGGIGILWPARDMFGFLLGAGVVLAVTVQALVNIAVVTASAPTKGIPLPFLTFGGSGLFATACQIGIVLSIDRVWRQAEGSLNPADESAPGAVSTGAPGADVPVAEVTT